MQVLKMKGLARDYSLRQKQLGNSVGFVPTMGALHEGHLELVRRARADNDVTTCSIFVNPRQFNNPEDLKKYPRSVEEDLAKLEKEGCDMVFVPSVDEMYPDAVEEEYDFGRLEQVMEGRFRPGHFRGVAVVVKRLFDIMLPVRAYFGEKDFQQLLIIKKLVEKESLPVDIVPCPIVREPDGLAMSSRNLMLSEEGRKRAPFIFQTLNEASGKIPATPPSELVDFVTERFRQNGHFELEYFEIVTMDGLAPVEKWSESPHIIACIAAYLEGIRLIDNMILFNNFAHA